MDILPLFMDWDRWMVGMMQVHQEIRERVCPDVLYYYEHTTKNFRYRVRWEGDRMSTLLRDGPFLVHDKQTERWIRELPHKEAATTAPIYSLSRKAHCRLCARIVTGWRWYCMSCRTWMMTKNERKRQSRR
jgi:hypothetical protein